MFSTVYLFFCYNVKRNGLFRQCHTISTIIYNFQVIKKTLFIVPNLINLSSFIKIRCKVKKKYMGPQTYKEICARRQALLFLFYMTRCDIRSQMYITGYCEKKINLYLRNLVSTVETPLKLS